LKLIPPTRSPPFRKQASFGLCVRFTNLIEMLGALAHFTPSAFNNRFMRTAAAFAGPRRPLSEHWRFLAALLCGACVRPEVPAKPSIWDLTPQTSKRSSARISYLRTDLSHYCFSEPLSSAIGAIEGGLPGCRSPDGLSGSIGGAFSAIFASASLLVCAGSSESP
jgi:hypothetical protein